MMNSNYDIVYELNDNNVKKTYIAHIIDRNNGKLIKTFEYYLLGHFSKLKNIWFWCDVSIQTDLIIRNKTRELRKTLKNTNNSQIIMFVTYDTLLLSTRDFDECIETISKVTNKDYVFDENDDIITVMLIDKILINNQ